jgi:glutamate transport system permease protein
VDVVWDNRDLIVTAFGHTVLLFLLGGIGSMIFGTILAAMRVGPIPVLRLAGSLYVTLVRNTPLLVVILFWRLAAPRVGINFTFVDLNVPTGAGDIRLNAVFTACTIALIVYTSAFVCEALRSGVNAVPLGQAEAARAIGLPFGGVMTQVVLPQAFRATVPPLASVQIALLKNTTVCGAFGVIEAFGRMRLMTNDYPTARAEIFLTFALVFVVLVEILSFVANRYERRWRVA